MKNLLKRSVILLFLSLSFSSCASLLGTINYDSFQDNPVYREKLVGFWTQDTLYSGEYVTIEFKDDGTGTVIWYKDNKVDDTRGIKYKVSDFQIVFNFTLLNYSIRANYVITDINNLSLVSYSNGSPNETYNRSAVIKNKIDHNDIESVLKKATDTVILNIPKETTIAIINISSDNSEVSEFIAGELENILVNNGFIVVDRSQLDRIRQEQNFQLSADVDDSSAVSMGKFAGANIVMTGAITGSGNMRRFRLRALDTQTARVAGSASEALLESSQ